MMGVVLQIFVGIIVVILLVVILVFVMRGINQRRYENQEVDQNLVYYSDPSNLSLYPTDLPHTSVEHIEGEYLNGFHLRPDRKKYKGVVVTFGGSDGTPSYEVAQDLTAAGYEVLALFYYGMPNQQPKLTRIPLEFYREVEAYIELNIRDNKPVTIYGLSKGAELGLNLVTYYDSIDHAVLVAPGAYNFSGLDYENYQEVFSTFTWQDEELPFIHASQSGFGNLISFFYKLATKTPIEIRPSYEDGVRNEPDLEAKRIKVEESNAKILLYAGGDDLMWHSAEMAQVIKDARPENTEVVIYENAGHLLFGERVMAAGPINIAMGGNQQANREANEAYMTHLLDRLAQWHGEL